MCIYIYIYVHIHIDTYIHVYIYIYIYIHTYTHMHRYRSGVLENITKGPGDGRRDALHHRGDQGESHRKF